MSGLNFFVTLNPDVEKRMQQIIEESRGSCRCPCHDQLEVCLACVNSYCAVMIALEGEGY